MPFMEEGSDLLKKYVNKNFVPTISYDVIKSSDILILTLGTPIDENMNPVLDQINDALSKIIPQLKKKQLIILRSTVSPETTIYVKDTIELKTDFKVGKDIFLAFCPERIAEGKSITETKTIPQIVGGVDNISTKKATGFFSELKVKTLPTDSTSAELAKLFTNMYRYINFAISNEFMVVAENFNRNIHEITELVNKDYKRGGLALPGLTGGPCLFKDGFFLVNDNPYSDLITTSWKINEAIPLFLVKKLKLETNLRNKKVTILGVAFKPEIDDTRESLSFKIRKALLREHAKVILSDPYVKEYELQEIESDYKKAIDNADIIIVATKHNLYKKNKDLILKSIKKNSYIVDVWNVFETNQIIFKNI
jgi:UDP-N-acetyl-D-mannosaminuronic acid dehydrogenase